MHEATYHELARLEHATKARVYARHGMYGRAESHQLRAAYHASFGAHAPSPRERATETLGKSARPVELPPTGEWVFYFKG